jgi:predicted helicase
VEEALDTSAESPRKRKKTLPALIAQYYADLKDLAHQNVMYEMGTRPAFHALLQAVGKEHKWTLIAEHEKKVNGKTIRPDGTFKDEMNLVRGYWEAKDTADKLDTEIEKKRKAGYPLNNIIFEDTATAVLYQHGQRLLTADMKDPAKLSELILQFFQYVEPEIEEFEHAVDEFKERVPDLAVGLAKKIALSHKANPAFREAFAAFFELCRTSLNPNLSQAAVDEMLIQHILTERLIREIFDNPEFVRRNVIAAEVEKVMQAMTSQSFDRNTYLKDLDRFYVAIERAARTMTDWSDKQYFLNTVYERFFQGYSVKLADTMGIVYTPQEIVDFMCASVAEVLEKEFGKHLWSDDVYIIDPCTGTGNFIVNLIRRIPKAKLEDVYKHRLFANEIMLLPYYIAALNIEHAYFEQAGKYEGFEGLCFVDTLDLAEHPQGQLGFMTAANTQRVERQRRSPITVVIGNPPYNVGQMIHNEQNANRAYAVVDGRVKDTYSRDSTAKSRSKLADPYVKFFRWATDRLEGRDGIVCYVSNNSFVEQVAFDGMRKHLASDFTSIYHFDLEGNVRQNPTLSGTQYNVFGIQVGVGITIAVRHRAKGQTEICYASVEKTLRRRDKLQTLAATSNIAGAQWTQITPDVKGTWLVPAHSDKFAGFIPLATSAGRAAESEPHAIFKDFSLGVATHRDRIVYDFSESTLGGRIEGFVDSYNTEVDRWKRAPAGADLDKFVHYETVVWDADLKQNLRRSRYAEYSPDRVRPAFYRPYTKRWLYFDRVLNARVYGFPGIFPQLGTANKLIWLKTGSEIPYYALAIDRVADLMTQGGSQCFPFYVYDEDGTNRRENITDWALDRYRKIYKDDSIEKWAIFHYVYGLLHHPGYREKFADNLKRELPRIPFAPDFRAFADAGEKLAKLHLDYEKLKPWALEFQETPGEPLSYRVEDKMRLGKDKTRLVVNKSLALAGIPPEALEYRLGNRSALEWVIDQYQVCTDKRSGITSDPNRADDEQYIVRLVGQVVRVSVETAGIVKGLPAEFTSPLA